MMTVRPKMMRKENELPANILKEVNEIEDEMLIESFDSQKMSMSYKRGRALKLINNLMKYLQDDKE
jgi:hypothetical protein